MYLEYFYFSKEIIYVSDMFVLCIYSLYFILFCLISDSYKMLDIVLMIGALMLFFVNGIRKRQQEKRLKAIWNKFVKSDGMKKNWKLNWSAIRVSDLAFIVNG